MSNSFGFSARSDAGVAFLTSHTFYVTRGTSLAANYLRRVPGILTGMDPDSTYAIKGGTPARLGYYDNYLVDNASGVIVGVQATAARMSQETVAAQAMITVSPQGKDESPNRWRLIRPTATGSSCNG